MNNKTIALVCPSAHCATEADPKAVQAYLAARHYRAIYQQETYQRFPAEQRAAFFLDALFNDEVELLWAVRGGEGAADLLPYIDAQRNKIAALPAKRLMGFSDMTALLVYFAQIFDWPVVHGPGARQLINGTLDEVSIAAMDAYLADQTSLPGLANLTPLNPLAEKATAISGRCIGGNLALLNISIGDIWQLKTDGYILVIEDVGEKGYQVWRTLKYFQRLGLFARVKAIVFGDFYGRPLAAGPSEQENQVGFMQWMFKSFAADVGVPVFASDQFGHGLRNLPLLFNSPAQIVDQHLQF